MKKFSIVMLAMLFVLSGALTAQGGSQRSKHTPGGGTGGTPPPKDQPQDGKKKEADLAADSLKAKWKDAKTLEITAVVKNLTAAEFKGARTAKIIFTGKDGKPETAKEESVTSIAASGSQTIKVDLTDAKYFAKDGKWTLEISAGDPTATNDKKGPMTLDAGAQPKG